MEPLEKEGEKGALLLVDFQENPSDQEIIFNFNKPFLYDALVVKLYKLIFNNGLALYLSILPKFGPLVSRRSSPQAAGRKKASKVLPL